MHDHREPYYTLQLAETLHQQHVEVLSERCMPVCTCLQVSGHFYTPDASVVLLPCARKLPKPAALLMAEAASLAGGYHLSVSNGASNWHLEVSNHLQRTLKWNSGEPSSRSAFDSKQLPRISKPLKFGNCQTAVGMQVRRFLESLSANDCIGKPSEFL